MSPWRRFPSVFEINAAVWLEEASRKAGKRISFAGVPDGEIERIASFGFDAVWLMGVWKRSAASVQTALAHEGLRREFLKALPDFTPEDLSGSPYAVADYSVEPAFGGDSALASLRRRFAAAGLKLILDFVPNHVALDHEWFRSKLPCFVRGTGEDLARSPVNWFESGGQVFAHGRDPNFDGWTDTVQIDYREPKARHLMLETLTGLSRRCDGLRCDMAMLPAKSVFLRTWGGAFRPPAAEFWPAAISEVKALSDDFLFLAEAYWDLEWELQQQGFDYCYDKRLYDRIAEKDASSVKLHLCAEREYQFRLARFVENHDERRAAEAFGAPLSRAAAGLVLTLPGLRLIHAGQERGFKTKLPVQLSRAPEEQEEPGHTRFFTSLLKALQHPVFHDGDWRLLEPMREWEGNGSNRNVVAHRWRLGEERRLAVGNLSEHPSQCFLPLDFVPADSKQWMLKDLTGEFCYVRGGLEMAGKGLYFDLPGHWFHLFRIDPA